LAKELIEVPVLARIAGPTTPTLLDAGVSPVRARTALLSAVLAILAGLAATFREVSAAGRDAVLRDPTARDVAVVVAPAFAAAGEGVARPVRGLVAVLRGDCAVADDTGVVWSYPAIGSAATGNANITPITNAKYTKNRLFIKNPFPTFFEL